MSQIQFINTIDPRARVLLEDQNKPDFGVPLSFESVAYYQANVQTNTNSTVNYVWTMNPDQILAPCIIEEYKWNVSLNISNNTGSDYTPQYIAPRAFPIESLSQSCQIKINNQVIGNLNPSECITPLMAFQQNYHLDDVDLNPMASMLDYYSGRYGLNADGTANTNSLMNPKNPFGQYYNSSAGITGRLAVVSCTALDTRTVAANTGGVRVFEFTVRTALMTGLTPMVQGNVSGFFGISNNVTVTRNFLGNIGARLVSLVLPNTGVTVAATVTYPVKPILYYQVFQVPQALLLKAPKKTYYKYTQYDIFNNNAITAVAANQASALKACDAVTVASNPKAIYIWATSKVASEKLINDSDAPGFSIQNLNINYGGKNNLFSDMSPFQLWQEFHCRQGGRFSFAECTGANFSIANNNGAGQIQTFGEVLRIDGSLLPLASDESVGSACSKTLQIYASVKATDPLYAGNVRINFLVVTDAVFEIDAENGSAQVLNGLIDREQIRLLRQQPFNALPHEHPLGGVFEHVTKFLGKHITGPLIKLGYKKLLKPHLMKKGGKRHSKRHHYRGGAMDEDETNSDEYTESEDYSDEEESMKGGSLVHRNDVYKRLSKK